MLRSARGGANSIPAGVSSRIPPVARNEPNADEATRYDEILDAAVRSEGRPQLLGVDAGDEEVGVPRLEPEQLVADGAADEIGVQSERADI